MKRTIKRGSRLALSISAISLLGAACASAPARPSTLRFDNAAPVWLVNDKKPTGETPANSEDGLVEYYFQQDLVEPTRRALTVGHSQRAANVNSLGGVPDSTWFENRRLTPEEVGHGPGDNRGPDRSGPWLIKGVKIGGAAIGLKIEDKTGTSYLLKFDERGHPETETSADVVVQRLTWALGYYVPDNEVVEFTRDEIGLHPEAVVENRAGGKRPMTEKDIDEYLSFTESKDGRYRALASRFIEGKIIGGFEPEGVRKDDPNDKVPHELRRDLRGQRVLWAWVNNVDLKTKNTLDTLSDDGYVVHYAIDFGKSLGTWARIDGLLRLGHRDDYGFKEAGISLITFGAWVHPWEKRINYPDLRGLGFFDVKSFDPAAWVPNHNWRPTDVADRFDEFWATEKLMALSPEHIAAAVDAGNYSDSRTADYLKKVLVGRQRKLGRYAFSRVAPLSEIEASGSAGKVAKVCFDDLWIQHGFSVAGQPSRYRATSFDADGKELAAPGGWIESTEARTCLEGVPAATGKDGYTIARLEVRRGGDPLPPLFVHLAIGPKGYRVIGIDRR